MSGGVSELACRNRLRSCDTKVKNKEEKKKMHSDDEEEEEEEEIRSSEDEVKNRKAKIRKMLINLSDDEEEELEMWEGDKKVKYKEEERMGSGDDKAKKRKLLSSHSGEKRSGDHDKDKRRSATFPLDNNKNFLKEKKNKLLSSHNGEKKMHSGDHDKDKRRNELVPLNKSKRFEKEKRKRLSSHNGEKKMPSFDHDKDKRRTVPLPFNKNAMQKNETNKQMVPVTCAAKEKKMQNCDRQEKKKKNAPPILSRENEFQTLTNNKKENKRKETTMLFKKKNKKTRTDDNDKKVESDDRRKEKKMQGDNKEQKVRSDVKENKRNAPPAFFKFVPKNFEEFLLIPPMIAPKLKDLTNRHVYLEDSAGKSSKIRLSAVNGSLAFYQGWNNFVSDHSIKLGDFLLFDYIAMSKFSVRVFGIDSCERVCFSVETKGGRKKLKESHAPDDLVPCHRGQNSEDKNDCNYVSGEYLGSKEAKRTADGYILNNGNIPPRNLVAKSTNAAKETHRVTDSTKEDPNRLVSGVGRGLSVALGNRDGYLANGEHIAKSISPACSKEKTRRSEIILITDETPLTQENEDTAKLTLLNATSETHNVTANTKEDPKEVASGAWCGPSVALDNKEGNLAIGECNTKSISPTCCKEKSRRSEIIVITDAAPLAQENDDAVKLTTFARHIEHTSMIRESEPEGSAPTKCIEIHDSDEDSRRKQEGNAVHLERTTVVDKCPNNSKMNTDGNVCRKYEAPGGSRCLEKWKKGIVSGQAALDGTGEKTEEKLVANCSAMGLNPVEQWLGYGGTNSCVQPMAGRISKSGHSRTEIDHCVIGKDTTVQLQMKKEQWGPMGSIVSRQRNIIPVHANHAVARQSEHHLSRQEDGKSSNCVTPVALLPVKAEAQVLELDDCSVLKTNLRFSIRSTTRTWLELPNSLSNAVRQKGRQDRSVIMLKDPMKRLWPVFYHENSLFVGFTTGWKPFVAANNLQVGDLCTLFMDLDEDEPVYLVQITKR